MQNKNIGFIGAGNMAQAIIGGLINSSTSAKNIYVFDPNKDTVMTLKQRLGINVANDNAHLFDQCDVILLAIKPQVTQAVLQSLQDVRLKDDAFLISLVAGLPVNLLQQWIGAELPMVRVMPNTPALIGAGMAGLFADKRVSQPQKDLSESIMRAVGSVIWVDNEDLIDVVTAVSGSGPAYFFYFIEALENAAIKHGLNPEQAKLLSLETAYGSTKLALGGDMNVAQLRERVTSPGGTTQAAILAFEQLGLNDIVNAGVTAAIVRAQELAKT